ncbi:dethiobiotin synthase [Rhodoblastus acidophilus]|uniref:ATP-dependent dethiobiotin synthetase BioD n=1 Tax=Candidatus Rhodoblastus alkanivorans TaxID=2954117 RepID=A0ABS9Z7E4_9HYPH|nr:dethiobiotin synthase [Candidatus Rhodoblastus alkanivorans]MCI4679559.1 dethiobiotin synthase [Candidatus Rhodoblastus alkanivorans]MCI4683310.1 dethiobiotin synthase [Candidatus Rhodoblastus alkanivorans]MDI4640623.1 dethiobiotin synthase [Rhodoblastus acidophilus]
MAIKYFITSTGTGIGKTYVTTALIRLARSKNMSVAAYKPVISGFDKQEIAGSDTGEILAALGEAPTEENVARVSPWRFAAPLAPNMAARAEGKTLDCDAILSLSLSALQENADLVLIEGVGGVMVPLDDKKTVLDWIVAAGAPVVLVVGDYLGTISHTLTAVEALRARGVKIAALVVSESGEATVSFDDTLAEIARWTAPLRVLGLRRDAGGDALAPLLA